MPDLLETLDNRLHNAPKAQEDRLRRHSRTYKCRCGNPLFFRNTLCLACNSQLAFVPDHGRLVAVDPGPAPGTWIADGSTRPRKFCANRHSAASCNWLIHADNPKAFCVACRLNRTIPGLDDEDNVQYWMKIERAKRRLVSQLIALNLPVLSKVDEDPERGLMFDFLRSQVGGPRVMTGHASGLITINVEEADDARREQIRNDLREPYRTLLGHFRHEVGHYYWDRLVWNSEWLEPFRALFGDERASYADALKRNYEQGPPADWAKAHISSYATMHPWEDWAETWAHYLHIVDSVGTALGFGLHCEGFRNVRQFTRDQLYAPDDPSADRYLALLNGWIEMVTVLNEMARSMGQSDFYPFVMSAPVVAKLQFIHMVIVDARADADL